MADTVANFSRSDLIDFVASMYDTSKLEAERRVVCTLEAIKVLMQERAAGTSKCTLTIRDFGCFSVVRTKAKKGRNPRTGETIDVPPSRKVSFSPSTGWKSTIKGIK